MLASYEGHQMKVNNPCVKSQNQKDGWLDQDQDSSPLRSKSLSVNPDDMVVNITTPQQSPPKIRNHQDTTPTKSSKRNSIGSDGLLRVVIERDKSGKKKVCFSLTMYNIP